MVIPMENKTLVLLVDDEDGICNFMSAILTANSFNVIRAAKGRDAVSMAASHAPDLIILDLGLPDMDGLDVLRQIRQWTGLPVVVVSSRGHEREKVEALDLGADDYITKPFGTAELLARIRTALRHSQKNSDAAPLESGKTTTGELEIDYDKRLVTIAGNEIHLTPVEYKIIVLFSRHIGKVLTYDYMIKEIWGPFTKDTYSSEIQALRVNMANIRRKLEVNPAEPQYIITEVGVGYRMIDRS
jgi:two-component system KDP operon response regulator KdpE